MVKTVLHIIDSLGVGGAESLLVKANVQLPNFEHIVVHLSPPNAFEKELTHLSVYCLNFKGWRSLPRCIHSLKEIIKENEVLIVHSHLYYAMIIARLACNNSVKLISSYHSLLYDPNNQAQFSWKLLLLDRLTYRKKYHLVFVSETVLNLISTKLRVKQGFSVIHNFIDSKFLNFKRIKSTDSIFRVVMVGNLRQEKNHTQALEALLQLKDSNIQIDIYGDGSERKSLESQIDQLNIKAQVNLKGVVHDTSQVLGQYDLFLTTSRFEGFGIALAEALAVGVPCLVSDIPAHKEVAGQAAVYFKSADTKGLAKKIDELKKSTITLKELRLLGKERTTQYTKTHYMENLVRLYERMIDAK